LEKKTLSQYERDIQEEADRLFVSGQIQENHKSESSDISGSVGADKGEGHSYDHEHQTNLKQAEVRSTGSLRSPDEHFEPAQNLN
jgi:hypothetical protein